MPKPDRRTERTRAALMSAFIGLLLAEGYEAVSVERIAEQANVGRSTFYMHYTGKDHILKQAMARPSSLLAVLVGNSLPVEAVLKQLEHFHQQRSRNHVFFAGPVRGLWVKTLAGLIEPRLAKLAQQTRARPLLPLPAAASQIAENQIALIAGWLTSKAPARIDAVADALVATTRSLAAALLRLSADAPLVIQGEKLRVVSLGENP